VYHISDLHFKFALGPHHVSKYGRPLTLGEQKKERKKTKQDKNIMSASATQGGHKNVKNATNVTKIKNKIKIAEKT